MYNPTRAELAAKITNLQKLRAILNENTDTSILFRCNINQQDKDRTILYELKQGDTPFDLLAEVRELIHDSLTFYIEAINRVKVI